MPKFLRGKGTGWLNAEYAILPTATHERIMRESISGHRDGRTVEISRVIGRALRSCVDLQHIGESTIIIDCDVLCADGGTRVASINAAALALMQAQEHWLSIGRIKQPFLVQKPAAIAIGITSQQTILVDPDYKEDVAIIADFNIIATQQGIIEVQGGAEKRPITWDLFNTLCATARIALEPFFKEHATETPVQVVPSHNEKAPLFALKNRLANAQKG